MQRGYDKYFLIIPAIVLIIVFLVMDTVISVRYKHIESSFLEQYFSIYPVTATWVGNHKYDGDLPDLNKEALIHRLVYLKTVQKQLDFINPEGLKGELQIDYGILSHHLAKEIFDLTELKNYEWNPLSYVWTLGFSYETLTSNDYAPLPERIRSLVSRFKNTQGFLSQAITNLKSMPQPHVETALTQINGLINWIKLDLENILEGIEPDLKQKCVEASLSALDALNKFQDFLIVYQQTSKFKDFRLGPTLYVKKLGYVLNENITAEDIIKRAEAELDATQMGMLDLAIPLYRSSFGEEPDTSSHENQLTVIRRVLDLIANDHFERKDVLSNVMLTVDELTKFIINNDIVSLDTTKPLEVRETPEYQRGVSIASLQSPGPLEKNINTFYNVSPVPDDWNDSKAESFLREYNHISVKILTIHEALPGHYVQLYYANKHPSIIRSIFSSGVMIEGWAHYCEKMMIDQGFGDDNEKYRLVADKWKLRGVANAIIDQKLHSGNLTEEKALNLMINETFQERTEAEMKWKRAQLTSCQLSTYFVGSILMNDLRHDVEIKMDSQFNLKKYHEELLSHGSIPIKYLRSIMLD